MRFHVASIFVLCSSARVVPKQAQHLPKMDLVGSVDPYVILRVGEEEHKSSTIKKNYNPEWKEEFVFNISDKEEELVLTLYDWDRMTKDDVIGCVSIKVHAGFYQGGTYDARACVFLHRSSPREILFLLIAGFVMRSSQTFWTNQNTRPISLL